MTTMEKVEVDPLWSVVPSRSMTSEEWAIFREEERAGTRGCPAISTEAQAAGEFSGDNGTWGCSRRAHPDHWKHIATGGNDHVFGCWGGSPPEDLAPDGEPDPDPGPFDLEIGVLYKFRNKATVLMVVGVRKDGKVEVLDLTHEKFRVLKPEQLVPRKEDAEPPTPTQMMWVGTFLAGRRRSVRDNALQQRRNGYFNQLGDLNGVLTELGMELYKPKRGGLIQGSLRVRTSGLTDQQARTRWAEWLNTVVLPEGFERTSQAGPRDVVTEMRDEGR